MSDLRSASGSGEERWKPPFMPWFEGDFAGLFNVRKMPPLARLMYRSLLMQGWHSDRAENEAMRLHSIYTDGISF